jgi:predicted YcjX-like family ATPase
VSNGSQSLRTQLARTPKTLEYPRSVAAHMHSRQYVCRMCTLLDKPVWCEDACQDVQSRATTDECVACASQASHAHAWLQGAGGTITDWQGQPLRWTPEGSTVTKYPGEVLAAGDKRVHAQALALLDWSGV